MKRKPHLQDGAVTIDQDKNRLVEIPTIGGKPSDSGLTEIQYARHYKPPSTQNTFACEPQVCNGQV